MEGAPEGDVRRFHEARPEEERLAERLGVPRSRDDVSAVAETVDDLSTGEPVQRLMGPRGIEPEQPPELIRRERGHAKAGEAPEDVIRSELLGHFAKEPSTDYI